MVKIEAPIGLDLPSDADLLARFPNQFESIIDLRPVPLVVWECDVDLELTNDYGLDLNPLHAHLIRVIGSGINQLEEIILNSKPVAASIVEFHLLDLIPKRLITQILGEIRLTQGGSSWLAEHRLAQAARHITAAISIADGDARGEITFAEESRRRALLLTDPKGQLNLADPSTLIRNGNFDLQLVRKVRRKLGRVAKNSRIQRVAEVRCEKTLIRGWRVSIQEGEAIVEHILYRSTGQLKTWHGANIFSSTISEFKSLDDEFIRRCIILASSDTDPMDGNAINPSDGSTRADPIMTGCTGLSALRHLANGVKSSSNKIFLIKKHQLDAFGQISTIDISKDQYLETPLDDASLFEYQLFPRSILTNLSPARIFGAGEPILSSKPYSVTV